MSISLKTQNELMKLEESLWKSETRFDDHYMNKVLAPDFFEFGRSGKIYRREDTLGVPVQAINAKFPLKNFAVHPITEDVVQVTYVSEVTDGGQMEVGNRSSIWVKTGEGYKLRFHQGTPVVK
jgi:hypothetical protein